MARVELNKADAERIRRALKYMDKKIKGKMQRDMRKAARPLVGKMKGEAPERSKVLRKSIVVRSSKYLDTIDVRVGPKTRGGKYEGWYSHFVELGTKDGSGATGKGQKANDFIKRSWNSNKAQITQAVIAAVNKYIKF
jgi:HK97 gp10 family phage protein